MNRLLLSVAVAALGAAPLSAQALAEGHVDSVRTLPDGANSVLRLESGPTVYFTGRELVLAPRSGGTRTLLSFSDDRLGLFTIRLDDSRLLFAESTDGRLWIVPLAPGSTPTQFASQRFTYSATAWTASHVIVSTKPGGFSSPGCALHAIDLVSGTSDRLADLPGDPGPLTRDADGSGIYYATTYFGAPPGDGEVVRFDTARLQSALGSGVLGIQDASLLAGGLGGIASLALDDDGDVFGVDYHAREVFEINRQTSGRRVSVTTFLRYPPAGPQAVGVQFVLQDGPDAPGAFEPFQPRSPGRLVVHEAELGGVSRLRTIEPRRATQTVTPDDPVSPGPFTWNLDDAPAHGTAVLAVAAGTLLPEIRFSVHGFEQPLFWSIGSFPAFGTIAVPLDANGEASRTFRAVPVPFVLPLTMQTGFVSQDARVVGTTPPTLVVLQ